MENKSLTIGDIAQALGVSKTTVSRAISGKGRIGEKTRRLVLDYINENNYRPNVIARGLAQNKTYNLGLVLPGDSNAAELPFFQGCMLGISRMASSRDYDVLVLMVTEENISQLKRAVTNRKVDGVILTRTLVEDTPLKFIRESGLPFVVIGSTGEEKAVFVDNDHRSACRDLTVRLLDEGVGNIALIGGDENHVVTGNRLRGFEEAFSKRPDWQGKKQIFLNIRDRESADEIVERLLEEGADCLVAMDDFLCSCIWNSLRQRQADVPGRIRLASFYDSAFLESYIPCIATVRFDVEKLGGRACEIMLKLLEGEEAAGCMLPDYEVRMGT